jgi:hypothetical protein
MTTYNTGNPIGSTDARDLYDNAENLDHAVNTELPEFVDRLGVTRKSLAGIQSEADAVVSGIQSDGSAVVAGIQADGAQAVADAEQTILDTLATIGSGGLPGAKFVQRIEADGVSTVYSLTATPLSTLQTDVYINGVYQQKNSYTLSGASPVTLVFSEPPPAPLVDNTPNIEVVVAEALTTDTLRGELSDVGGSLLVGHTPTVGVPTTVRAALRGMESSISELQSLGGVAGLPLVAPTIRVLPGVAKALPAAWTFTRASDASVVDFRGDMVVRGSNVPRFQHNPLTGECLGLLIEPAATNLLLNSTTLSTQSVTVTAASHTLSFYGSGTVTLSGAASAVVVGLGAYPTRTTLTFTPAAGTLTATVTGTVVFANLELGAYASSWIPTTDAVATRTGEIATLSGADFSNQYRAGAGTIQVEIQFLAATGNANTVALAGTNTATDVVNPLYFVSTNVRGRVLVGGAVLANANLAGTPTPGTVYDSAIAFATDNVRMCLGGGPVIQDTSVTIPTIDRLVAFSSGAAYLVRAVNYWPYPVSDAELQKITSTRQWLQSAFYAGSPI